MKYLNLPVQVLLVIAGFVIVFFGWPYYRVWQQEKQGESEWRRAVFNRKIKIEEARADEEAARARAAADTIRAHGVARANQIIGVSLKNNELYLHYLWLQNLEKNEGDVIYVPTEANFPIMEAGRFFKTQPSDK